MNKLTIRKADLYRVFTALRGPDVETRHSSDLKAMFTARLRVIVFKPSHIYGLRETSPFNPADMKTFKALVDKISPREALKLYHFLEHLLSAISATSRNAIWGRQGAEIIEVLRQIWRKAIDLE